MNSSRPSDPSLVTQVTHRAMATEFVVMLPSHHADAVEVAVEALEELDRIEQRMTVYRPDSEISRVNLEAASAPVMVSQATFDLIERAILWSDRTGGAFDITAGPLVTAWGFTQRRGRKPTSDEVHEALGRVGYKHLKLDANRRTVRFMREGMSINLGGIGKGDAIDRITAQLRSAGVNDFLLHGGNSSVIACGDQTRGSEMGWAVGIAHPTKPNRRIGGIWLRDAALATSGSGKQFFHHRGRRYGHVIDPRTGYPAGDLLALTVITPLAADADACSTGFFVNGRDAIPTTAEWPFSVLTVAAGQRQDDVELSTIGEVPWVDETDESFGGVSRPQ